MGFFCLSSISLSILEKKVYLSYSLYTCDCPLTVISLQLSSVTPAGVALE